jgi:hypothetical protein
VAQVVDRLLSKHKALNSNSSPTEKKSIYIYILYIYNYYFSNTLGIEERLKSREAVDAQRKRTSISSTKVSKGKTGMSIQ